MQEKIIADSKEHAIEVRPLTLLFHHGNINIQCPGRFEINPEATVRTADTLKPGEYALFLNHPQLRGQAEKVLGDALPEFANLAKASLATRHVVGLLALLAVCAHKNIQPFIRFPETYLHPAQQVELGDLFNAWSHADAPPSLDLGGGDVPTSDLEF